MLPIKLLYKVRRFLFAALLARVPALSAFSRSVPVKTLAMLSCAGCISVSHFGHVFKSLRFELIN